MKRPIIKDFESINAYFLAIEEYSQYLEGLLKVEEEEPLDIIYFRGALVENDEAIFRASMNQGDTDDSYYSFSVDYTDKRKDREDWEKTYWDNGNWFDGILEGTEQSLYLLGTENLSKDTTEMFLRFLRELKDKGWF